MRSNTGVELMTSYCGKCGARLGDIDVFCGVCGTKVSKQPTDQYLKKIRKWYTRSSAITNKKLKTIKCWFIINNIGTNFNNYVDWIGTFSTSDRDE